VVSACAICMATLASAGKNNLAKATAGMIHRHVMVQRNTVQSIT
jgi:hypothetical protein